MFHQISKEVGIRTQYLATMLIRLRGQDQLKDENHANYEQWQIILTELADVDTAKSLTAHTLLKAH